MIVKVPAGQMFSLTRGPSFAFFSESKIAGSLDFNHFCRCWDSFIESGIGVVMVSQKEGVSNGLIGGLVTRCFMTGDPIATECFWWIAPELRGGPTGIRLLLDWEQEVKQRGVKRIYVGNLHAVNHEKMQELYARLGYQSLETHYVKPV